MSGSAWARGSPLVDRLAPWMLLVVAVAEVVNRATEPRLGAIALGAVAVLGLNAAAVATGAGRRLILAAATVAIARLLGLAAPFVDAGPDLRLLGLALIVALAVALATSTAGPPSREDAAPARRWWLLAIAAPIGFGIGFTLQQLAAPTLLLEVDRSSQAVGPLAALAVVGLVEELLLRGLVQGAAVDRLGAARGILVVSALSALLGTVGPPWVLGLAAGIALVLGLVSWRLGSILPAAIAHAALNVGIAFFALTAP